MKLGIGSIDRMYKDCDATRLGLSRAEFVAILQKHNHEVAYFKDLVVAQACVCGHEEAWVYLFDRYRNKLASAAVTFVKDISLAQELTESLWSDLFASKLASYDGRGSLETWLKVILSRKHIDYLRSRQKYSSIEAFAETLADERSLSRTSEAPDPRLEQALTDVLQDLKPEDRFILVSYFLDGRTLSEVANALGVHESTVSRRVSRITRLARKRIPGKLRLLGMLDQDVEQAMKTQFEEFKLDLRSFLLKGVRAVEE